MNNRSSISVLERNLDYLGKIYGNKKVVQRFLFKEDDGSDVYFTDKIQIYNIYLPLIKEKLSKFEEILLIFNENDKDLLNKKS